MCPFCVSHPQKPHILCLWITMQLSLFPRVGKIHLCGNRNFGVRLEGFHPFTPPTGTKVDDDGVEITCRDDPTPARPLAAHELRRTTVEVVGARHQPAFLALDQVLGGRRGTRRSSGRAHEDCCGVLWALRDEAGEREARKASTRSTASHSRPRKKWPVPSTTSTCTGDGSRCRAVISSSP